MNRIDFKSNRPPVLTVTKKIHQQEIEYFDCSPLEVRKSKRSLIALQDNLNNLNAEKVDPKTKLASGDVLVAYRDDTSHGYMACINECYAGTNKIMQCSIIQLGGSPIQIITKLGHVIDINDSTKEYLITISDGNPDKINKNIEQSTVDQPRFYVIRNASVRAIDAATSIASRLTVPDGNLKLKYKGYSINYNCNNFINDVLIEMEVQNKKLK